MIKCQIVRDLLPSYIDGLTSEESNAEIEEHLKNCQACKSEFDRMKEDIELEKLSDSNKQVKENPFLKIKKKFKYKNMLIALISIEAIIFTLYTGVNYLKTTRDIIEYSDNIFVAEDGDLDLGIVTESTYVDEEGNMHQETIENDDNPEDLVYSIKNELVSGNEVRRLTLNENGKEVDCVFIQFYVTKSDKLMKTNKAQLILPLASADNDYGTLDRVYYFEGDMNRIYNSWNGAITLSNEELLKLVNEEAELIWERE